MNPWIIVVPLVSIFLLTSVWTFIYSPEIGFTVMGFYGLGTSGLFLMHRSIQHIKNPDPNPKKAYTTLFVGFLLLFTSYYCLEILFWSTMML